MKIPPLPEIARRKSEREMKFSLLIQGELQEALQNAEQVWSMHWRACSLGEECPVHKDLTYVVCMLRMQVLACAEEVSEAPYD